MRERWLWHLGGLIGSGVVVVSGQLVPWGWDFAGERVYVLALAADLAEAEEIARAPLATD